MAIAVGDLTLYLSGGVANIQPDLSWGGVMSTQASGKVKNQDWTNPSLVTGVVITDAKSNSLGVGLLKWDVATQALYWKPYGSTAYVGTLVTTSGDYTLGDASGYLKVTVTYSSLPSLTQQDNITISSVNNNVYDNISAYQSLVGSVEYRCLYMKNTNPSGTANDVKIWVKSQPTGGDVLAIGLDPAGVGNGSTTGVAKTITGETDPTNVLAGGTPVVFSAPISSAEGLLLGTLLAGECRAFWIRRTVPVESTTMTDYDSSSLGFSATL